MLDPSTDAHHILADGFPGSTADSADCSLTVRSGCTGFTHPATIAPDTIMP